MGSRKKPRETPTQGGDLFSQIVEIAPCNPNGPCRLSREAMEDCMSGQPEALDEKWERPSTYRDSCLRLSQAFEEAVQRRVSQVANGHNGHKGPDHLLLAAAVPGWKPTQPEREAE